MKMTIRLLGLICLVFTHVCFFNGANLSADDSWKNLYGICGKASQPNEAIKYAKQIGYDYLALASGTGPKAIYAANPARAGLKFYIINPERLQNQIPTITVFDIDTSLTYTQEQINFFNDYMTWKSTDAFPNNMATGWFFSASKFSVRWDLQQQKVIDYLVEQFISLAKSYENASLPFTFAGYILDVAKLSGDFNIYDAAKANLNTTVFLSYWTGSESGLVHGTITHEYTTYSEAKAAFFKKLNTRMREVWPDAKWIVEPWTLYDAKVERFNVDEWIYQIKDRSDKDALTPDMLFQEKAVIPASNTPVTDFVDNASNFNLGVNITKDMVGISQRISAGEDLNRLFAAKAGINGAWYNWLIAFSGTTGDMPQFTSITEVYPRLKLIRLIPNWDNLNNIPLANRSWNSSTTDPIYNSYDSSNNQQSYVDGNVMYSRHPKTGKLFAVFNTTNGVINLKVCETVDSIQRTDGYFVESGDASADFDITGNEIRLKSSISIDVDSSNNQVKGNGYIFTLSEVTTGSAAPVITTGSATNVTSVSAALNGTVNAGGLSTMAWFEYGVTSGSYGSRSPALSIRGSSDTTVSFSISELSPVKTYYYRLIALNCAGTTYGNETPFTTLNDTSLRAHYLFDEGSGTICGDSSGSGNSGTLNGCTWTTGKSGGALSYNGTSDYVSIPLMNSDEITIGAWFYKNGTDTTNEDAIFGGWRGNSDTQLREGLALRFYQSTPNRLDFMLVTKDGNGIRTFKQATYAFSNSVGNWHHVVGTYKKTTGEQKLYVNGKLVDTQNHPAGNTIVPLTFYHDMRIGRGEYKGYFKGKIDDVSIYNRPLSDQEVQDMYNTFNTGLQARYSFEEGSGAVATDTSANGNNGIINGATWTTGKSGNGLSFNGTSDYVSIPRMNNDEISVSAWFYKNANDTLDADTIFAGYKWNSDVQIREGLALRFYNNKPDRLVFILVTQDGNGNKTQKIAIKDLVNSVGSWYHVVGAYNKVTGGQKLYVNGQLVNTQIHPAGNTVVPLTYQSDMRIGRGEYKTGYFNGKIDEVRFYNQSLSDQEVLDLYNN